MERISRDQMLMEVATAVAKRGTCSRLQVGAVVSRGGRIVATGYNGAPAGLPHCQHPSDLDVAEAYDRYVAVHGVQWSSLDAVGPFDSLSDRDHGTRYTLAYAGSGQPRINVSCVASEHAERNAVAFAARHGLALEGAELHCTHAPCVDCARAIINAGIVRVIYLIPYRLTNGVELLAAAGVDSVHFEW